MKGSTVKAIKDNVLAWCFLLPFGILYSVYTIWPVIQGVYVSFHKWNLMGKQSFVGLANYQKMFIDKQFWTTLGNTTMFSVILVPIIVVLSLVLALLANRRTRMKRGLRIIYYLPSVLSVAVISQVIKNMFNPDLGFINQFLQTVGIIGPLDRIQWMTDGILPWITIIIATTWWTIGFPMLLYIAALQDISEDIYEAAEIDGASGARTLFSITLPMIKNTIYMVLMLQVIANFKIFGQVQLMTNGGPGMYTKTLIQYIWESAFRKNDMGYGAAMSYVLFIILVVLTLIQQFVQRRSERT